MHKNGITVIEVATAIEILFKDQDLPLEKIYSPLDYNFLSGQ